MIKDFELQGIASGAIRSDEEMKTIDKELADNVFKLQKKKMDFFMQQKGFVKYKSNSYVRRNKLNVLEYINLQKERYGSKTFTVNYALISLYVPHSFLSFDLGDRLGVLICNKDIWWDYSNEQIAETSFQNVMEAIEMYLLPWFEERENKESLKRELMSEKKKREGYGGRLSDDQQKWLDVVDSEDDFTEIVSSNIEIFKLPKKLC
ncbi:DUF4304 domain-containing protein [uncultured Eubacterium sp.]|uniref:DUF4304 domain-containing protein n=1 Tax=uncultured Eubacterium sp. TaxID=165185 RepID=UPI002591D302|nr:DUF4304 domain-containing protein [uncultured Eubacterium sp.]